MKCQPIAKLQRCWMFRKHSCLLSSVQSVSVWGSTMFQVKMPRTHRGMCCPVSWWARVMQGHNGLVWHLFSLHTKQLGRLFSTPRTASCTKGLQLGAEAVLSIVLLCPYTVQLPGRTVQRHVCKLCQPGSSGTVGHAHLPWSCAMSSLKNVGKLQWIFYYFNSHAPVQLNLWTEPLPNLWKLKKMKPLGKPVCPQEKVFTGWRGLCAAHTWMEKLGLSLQGLEKMILLSR